MLEKIKKQIDLENYFLLVIILLPTYLLRFSIFGIPTNSWEILAMSAIALSLWKEYKNITFSGYEKKIIILFLIIILGLTIGMIKSGNYRIGSGIIKGWFVIPFIFAFLTSKVIKNKNKAYFSLFLSVAIVAIIALVYKIFGIVTYDGRLQAIFNSPNYLAMFLAPGIIIGIFSQHFLRFHLRKFLKFLVLAVIALAIFFTFSYASWISIVLAMLVVFFLGQSLSKKHILFLILIFFSIIFLLKDTNKFQDLANYNSRSSLASRVMIWQSAEKILSDNYVLGIGPGNFQEKYLEYQKYFPPYLQWAVPHPHNLCLAFWLNSGIIGLLSFLAILYLFFVNVETPRRGVSTGIKCISFGIVVYFLLHGLVDTTYFKNDLAVIFWLAILI